MKCSYCEIKLTEVTKTKDHVFPWSFGGRTPGNVVWACGTCNKLKGNRLVSPINPQWVRNFKQKNFNRARKNLLKRLIPLKD